MSEQEILPPEQQPLRAVSGRRARIQAARAVIEKLASDGGVLPVEVLVEAMRMYWRTGQYEEAVVCAEKAAPYFHPKLATIEVSADETLRSVVRAPARAASTQEWLTHHTPQGSTLPSSTTRQ